MYDAFLEDNAVKIVLNGTMQFSSSARLEHAKVWDPGC